MLNAKIFIPRKPILYQTDLSTFLVFLWIHQNPYVYSNYTKWIKICVASRIVHIFQLWRSTIFSLTAVNGYCPTQNVSAINCVECFTSSFFGGKIFYHDKFDLAPLGQCFLKNCWLTVNNIIPPCAFVKNGQIPLAVVTVVECHVYEKVWKRKCKSWTKHSGAILVCGETSCVPKSIGFLTIWSDIVQ